MLVVCWSPKGGSGTSVVAAGLALCSGPSLLVDTDGDQPALLGSASDGPGVSEWLGAWPDTPVEALGRVEITVNDTTALLPWGRALSASEVSAEQARLAVDALCGDPRLIVVDAGRGSSPIATELRSRADVDVCVLRPCYLAVTRAAAATSQGSSTIVLIDEPGRALRRSDVAAALDAPVEVVVPWDPAIARAVDAGVLGSRQPKVLSRPLRRLVERVHG